MGIVFRQSIKTTIVTFIGAALGALSIYIAAKLPPQDWGFSKNILTQAIVFSQVVLIGVHSMLYLNDIPKCSVVVDIIMSAISGTK